jgi:hypothetical protein
MTDLGIRRLALGLMRIRSDFALVRLKRLADGKTRSLKHFKERAVT